jgi:ornithine cyclodeaminase
VVIGYVEQTKRDRAADIFQAIESGSLDWRRICQLGEIVVGSRAGRVTPEEITVFKNNGLAVEFVALAAKVDELARSRGRGEEIPERYFSQPRRQRSS